MPFYLFVFSRLVAYPIRQAVQSMGSTSHFQARPSGMLTWLAIGPFS